MKRFRNIIQDTRAPSTSDLWINNGELKYYTSNGWKAIAGNGSSDVYVLPGNLQTTEGWSTTVTIDNFLCVSSVVDRLNSSGTELPLSANQGRILNDRVTELKSKSNVAVLTPTGTKLMELVSRVLMLHKSSWLKQVSLLKYVEG